MRFVRWLVAGCPVVCPHGERVVSVTPLGGSESWRHKDDGSVCEKGARDR